MNKRGHHRGFSLLEVLIATALFGLVLSVLYQILIPGLKIWQQTQAISELEQNALKCELKLRELVLPSSADSFAVIDRTDLQALSLLAHEGSDTTVGYDPVSGRAFWRSMTLLRHIPGSGRLTQLRWAEPPLPTTQAFAFSPVELEAALSTGTEVAKLSDKISSFQVSNPVDTSQWVFRLTFTGETPMGTKTLVHELTLLPRIQKEPE